MDNIEYVLNYIEYRILELCDGGQSTDEIVDSLGKDLGKTKAEATEYVTIFLDKMFRMGMIAWRQGEIEHSKNCPPPSTVYWDITGECNLRCAHCFTLGGKPHENELSTEEIKHAIEEMAHFGVEKIAFSGGEPLMRKDLIEIASYASGLGFKSVNVATNGTLIDTRIAKLFKKANLNVQVSIDGDISKIHDELRGDKGAFDRAICGIKLLMEEGVNTSVCTTATKLNVDRMPDIIQFMQNLGVKNHRIQIIMPMGRGKINIERLDITPRRLKSLVEYLDVKNITDVGFNFTLKPPPEGSVDFSRSGACSGGYSICSITPEGNVVPCTSFWGMNGDNLREHNFRWIWENSRLLNYFRSIRLDDIKGVCRDCKWLSRCHGGCKAENYAHGDIFGSSKSCWVADEMRRIM